MIWNSKAHFKKYKLLLLVIMMFLWGSGNSANAQCTNKVTLINVEHATAGQNSGLIEVQVNSSGSFNAELYKVTGAGKEIVQKTSGNGSQNLVFRSLSSGDNYQVLVIFNDEEEVFCKKRQISEISTSKN